MNPKPNHSILFVDDEPNIRNGIRRMLRFKRDQWHMVFAGGSEEALNIMAREHFDIIVSDMRMPGIDGADLLEQVKKRYPDTARIVLSGFSEEKNILRTVHQAHQYLAKPCDKDTICSIISDVCTLKHIMTDERLASLVSGIESLPSLPELYIEVSQALEKPDCTLEELGGLIAKDISMSAKILQLVNSAFFGLPKKISDIKRAVVFLGLETLRALVLTIGLFEKMDRQKTCFFDLDLLFDHSLRTGHRARKIARHEGAEKGITDAAFMAGLLHDLGKLILAENLADEYRPILEMSIEEEVPIHLIEKEKLGATHSEIGAYLLGLWGLPGDIVEAVAFHHALGGASGNNVVGALAAVHIADNLDYEKAAANQKDPFISYPKLDTFYLKHLGGPQKLASWKQLCQDNS